jgi:predicted transglutaminase-like cysteine proteinase
MVFNVNTQVARSVGRFTVAVLISMIAMAGSVAPAAARSKAPLGYQLMCLRTPAECQGGGASQVKANSNIMATLKSVNTRVNNAITPRNDQGADVWNANATVGDCEDYVLAKRRALIKAGLPASSLRIAYVKTKRGEGHAILVVKTSKGDYVLDNLNRSVRPLSQSGYRIVSMSGANPGNWS